MNPIGKRRLNAEENRTKMMENAIRLFQEHGYENVTIDDIVKAAGFSRGTFYKLFISKDDLVISYMVRWNALYDQYYRNELEHSDMDALEKIRLLMRFMLLASTQGGPEFQRLAIASSLRDDVLAEKMAKAHEEIDSIYRHILQEGKRDGCITVRYTDEELINMIYTVIEGTALRWALSRTKEGVESHIQKSIELTIHAMRRESS